MSRNSIIARHQTEPQREISKAAWFRVFKMERCIIQVRGQIKLRNGENR